jgi:hypothetical protein
MKALGENGIRRVVRSEGVRFSAVAPGEGKEVGDDVGFALQMLRGQAMVMVEQEGRKMSRCHQVSFVSC